MRNKKLLWILVMLVLIVSSAAVTALSNPFRGVTSKLGGLTGWGVIAVNAAIIAAVLYFGLSLIPKIKPGSKPAQLVMAGVVIALGIMFAIQIGDQFIFSTGAFKDAVNYLFKDSYTVDGETVNGILNPNHIWKFVGMSLILSWLFITFLDVGKGKHFIDIAIAIIISANAAHGGLEPIRVIHLGQAIALIILTHQFSKQFGIGNAWTKWFFSFAVALLLVYWISSIVFPNYGFLLFGEEAKTVAGKQITEGRSTSWFIAQLVIAGIALGVGPIVGAMLDRVLPSRTQQQPGAEAQGDRERTGPESPEGEEIEGEETGTEEGGG